MRTFHDRPGRRCALLSLVGIATALAGCTSSSAPPPACPRPAIVSGLESANFGAGGVVTETPTDIVFRAVLAGFSGGCAYGSDNVQMRIFLDLAAVPGPAYDRQPFRFPYFVAVQRPDGTFVAKQLLQAELPAATGPRAVAVQDTIEQTIAGVTPATASGWRILIGIDLPPDIAVRRFPYGQEGSQ